MMLATEFSQLTFTFAVIPAEKSFPPIGMMFPRF